jgi:hypothetical protein
MVGARHQTRARDAYEGESSLIKLLRIGSDQLMFMLVNDMVRYVPSGEVYLSPAYAGTSEL